MNQLIGCEYTDYDNSKKNFTIEDILIVSPYNAQVNFLLARLEKGAQIGTIDKWQGAEKAPINNKYDNFNHRRLVAKQKSFFLIVID